MTDITLIICGIAIILVGLIGFVIFRYIKPFIQTKIPADQWNTIVSLAEAFVSFAEKTISGEHGLGGLRFEKVFDMLQEFCNEYNFKFNENVLKSAIQLAWANVIGQSDKKKEEEISVIEYKSEISE